MIDGKNPNEAIPLGLPSWFMAINNNGPFFKTNAIDGSAFVSHVRRYPGASVQSRRATILHELAHLTTPHGAFSDDALKKRRGFLSDTGIENAQINNDRMLDQYCRAIIE